MKPFILGKKNRPQRCVVSVGSLPSLAECPLVETTLALHLGTWPVQTSRTNKAHSKQRAIVDCRETRIIPIIILFITVKVGSELAFFHWLNKNAKSIIMQLWGKKPNSTYENPWPTGCCDFSLDYSIGFILLLTLKFSILTWDIWLSSCSTNPVKTDESATSYNSISLQLSAKHALCCLERGFKLMRQNQQCPNSEHMLSYSRKKAKYKYQTMLHSWNVIPCKRFRHLSLLSCYLIINLRRAAPLNEIYFYMIIRIQIPVGTKKSEADFSQRVFPFKTKAFGAQENEVSPKKNGNHLITMAASQKIIMEINQSGAIKCHSQNLSKNKFNTNILFIFKFPTHHERNKYLFP